MLSMSVFEGLFANIADSFAGRYKSTNNSIDLIKKELDNTTIPSISEDGYFLRNDVDAIKADYHKSFKEAKQKHGQTK